MLEGWPTVEIYTLGLVFIVLFTLIVGISIGAIVTADNEIRDKENANPSPADIHR